MSFLSEGRVPRPIIRAVLRARAMLLWLANAIIPAQVAVLDVAAGVISTVSLHIAAKHRFADHLASGRKTKEQLAACTALDAGVVSRVMSALICSGIFRIDGSGRYANNRASESMRTDVEGSIRSMAEYFGDEVNLVVWADFAKRASNAPPSFDLVHGANVWQHFGGTARDKGELFTQAMSELTTIDAPTIATGYPFGRFARICDVAGGRGTLLAAILHKYAGTRGVLFDEPYVLEAAGEYLKSRGVLDRVERTAGNFFERVPDGCDAYLLKDILHDWDDDRCLTILRAVRKAMTETSRLLVIELPIDHRRPEYPAPVSDMYMLAVTGGKQRSAAELAALFTEVGLKMASVTPLATPMTIFEAVPV